MEEDAVLGTSPLRCLPLLTLSAKRSALLILVILGTLASLPEITATISGGTHYVKVERTFPSNLNSKCFLRKDVLRTRSHVSCAALCSVTSECSLFCLKGQECHLFKARVTRNWLGLTSATESNTFDSCYSSWAYKDISFLTNASSQSYYGSRVPARAIDGYSCDWEANYCSTINPGHWFRLDLPETSPVTEIKFQSYSNSDAPELFFGNSTTYSDNLKIATREDTQKDANAFFSVKPPQDFAGKYIFAIAYANYLHICELAIIIE